MWVYSRRHSFPILPGGGFNSSADGAIVDAWPYFPGLKVGRIYLYSFFLTVWWPFDNESLDSTDYDYSWARQFECNSRRFCLENFFDQEGQAAIPAGPPRMPDIYTSCTFIKMTFSWAVRLISQLKSQGIIIVKSPIVLSIIMGDLLIWPTLITSKLFKHRQNFKEMHYTRVNGRGKNKGRLSILFNTRQ